MERYIYEIISGSFVAYASCCIGVVALLSYGIYYDGSTSHTGLICDCIVLRSVLAYVTM